MGKIRDMCEGIGKVVKDHNYFPHIQTVEGVDGSTVDVDGREVINLASNSYLGLGQHSLIIEAAQAALREFGIGTGGSRLTAGTQVLHRRLEERIACFKGAEDAVVFSDGYLANVGILPALTGITLNGVVQVLTETPGKPEPIDVFFDELVHASILDGLAIPTSRIFASGATIHRFHNRNMEKLEYGLAHSTNERKLIVVDGVFSLHGRLAPLGEIVRLARQYGAEIYVDDAHGLGVFGANGHGVAEHFGVESEIDFAVGTLSKAVGASGGYITGSREFCDYLRIAARTQMFQTSMPPATVAGIIAAFDVMEKEPWRRERVQSLSATVRNRLLENGFDILGSETQIIPICFRSSDNAKAAADKLWERGIFAPPYYYPAVRKDEGMIRANITAGHTDGQVDQFLEVIKEIGVDLGVIGEAVV